MCSIQQTVKSWILSLEVTTAYSCVLGQMDRSTKGFGVPGQVLNALKSHLDQVSDHEEKETSIRLEGGNGQLATDKEHKEG